MPENTKEDEKNEKKCEKSPEKSSSGEDRTTRSYYYDDACGYEIYNADDETEENS